MVHGMGFRDRKHLCYWGRVPKRLESHGAKVFFGHQDSVGSVESNADIIARSLDEVLAQTGAEKVNIRFETGSFVCRSFLPNFSLSGSLPP